MVTPFCLTWHSTISQLVDFINFFKAFHYYLKIYDECLTMRVSYWFIFLKTSYNVPLLCIQWYYIIHRCSYANQHINIALWLQCYFRQIYMYSLGTYDTPFITHWNDCTEPLMESMGQRNCSGSWPGTLIKKRHISFPWLLMRAVESLNSDSWLINCSLCLVEAINMRTIYALLANSIVCV